MARGERKKGFVHFHLQPDDYAVCARIFFSLDWCEVKGYHLLHNYSQWVMLNKIHIALSQNINHQEREGGKERERQREREREREREGKRERDRERERERERGRQRDCETDRETDI